MRADVPVWHVYVDDGGLQELPLLVSAGHQDPALVVGEAVTHKQHVVLGGDLCPDLTGFWQLGTVWTQDEGGTVELQRTGILQEEKVGR